MPWVDRSFNFGRNNGLDPELLRILAEMYETLADEINRRPDYVLKTSNPGATDTRYRQGTIWINQSTDKVYVLTSKVAATGAANWSLLN
jgi:hypothetical protein